MYIYIYTHAYIHMCLMYNVYMYIYIDYHMVYIYTVYVACI